MLEEDYDEMAELFSFGAETGGASATPSSTSAGASSQNTTMPSSTTVVGMDSSYINTLSSLSTNVNDQQSAATLPKLERTSSNDSFLDLLESETASSRQPPSSSLSSLATITATDMGGGTAQTSASLSFPDDQELLDWLDEDDYQRALIFANDDVILIEDADQTEIPVHIAEAIQTPTPTVSPTTNPVTTLPLPQAPPPLPEPLFDSLLDALQSPKTSLAQIRHLSTKETIDATIRPSLWCRLICGKSLQDVEKSSLADSFQEWQDELIGQDETEVVTKESRWIHREAPILANRIIMAADEDHRTVVDVAQAERDLRHILLFHYHSSANVRVALSSTDNEDVDDDNNNDSSDAEITDPLIPPVACTILSAGIPVKVASIMLETIMPTYMPLLALTANERWEAAKSLHAQFYLLACYHLPLLVLHLDRYFSGWHCPKQLLAHASAEEPEIESATQMGRNLEAHGVVPQSWLISHLAGECNGTMMNPKWLLSLWDTILTSSNNSLRFFLALAILEKHAESLLLLTGNDLVAELHRIMEFKEGTTSEGFSIEAEDETSEKEAEDWVEEWTNRAQSLFESTPQSVVAKLRVAEDDEVARALELRQKIAEEKLKAKMEAQAKAYREAMEAERDRVADEARERLTRARLVAYYRKFNPEKEGNIDIIMKNYAGRYDVLDAKLKAKYGVGFNPALKPKPLPKTNQILLSTMGNGFGSKRNIHHRDQQSTDDAAKFLKPSQVCLTVTPAEVIPSVCWSKEAIAARGEKSSPVQPTTNEVAPLKFFLVDSRSAAAVEQQGRFPTAAPLGPEVLLDPERIQQSEESFESLRSSVHICIMGDGYSALPGLYGHKVDSELESVMKEDESQTYICALFFIKKGFPFVSILDGGFARAHAWLVRQGPKHNLPASSVLVDYDPETSLFGQLETLFKEQQNLANATTRERTQRALQNLFDSSMTSLTRNTMRLEFFAADFETGQKVRSQVSKLFVKSEESPKVDIIVPEQLEEIMEGGTTPPPNNSGSTSQALFRNPFSKMVATTESDANVEKIQVGLSEVVEGGTGVSDNASLDHEQPPTTVPESSIAIRLAGLGAALNMSLKQQQDIVGEQAPPLLNTEVKRNPFARFGAMVSETARGTNPITTTSSTTGEPDSSANNNGLANRFGGWNALRKNTLAKIRSGSDKGPVQEIV